MTFYFGKNYTLMVKTSLPNKILITARFDGSVGAVINWKNLFNRLDWLFSTFCGAVFLSILLFPSDDNSCIKKGFIVKVQLAPQNGFSKTKSSNIVLVTWVKKILWQIKSPRFYNWLKLGLLWPITEHLWDLGTMLWRPFAEYSYAYGREEKEEKRKSG